MAITITEKSTQIERLEYLLEGIDPNDISYDYWVRALMVILHDQGGSEEGYQLALRWSSRRRGYRGEEYVASNWILAALLVKIGGESPDSRYPLGPYISHSERNLAP